MPKTFARRLSPALFLLLAAGPALAQQTAADPQLTAIPAADRLTLAGIFAHAGLPVKVVLFGLLAASLAAAAVWVVQLVRPGQRLAAASAWLSGLAAAAPLVGLLGASYTSLNCFIGISNVRPTPSLTLLAPGLAEASLSVGLGLLAAALATLGHRHLQARLLGADAAAPKPAAETGAGAVSGRVRASA
ncbi:MAG: hypothetical protein JWQ29_1699 [Phenylobacterium sp.]|nr:hypothetical protein [Phenylobacterium sp.]